MSSKRIVIIGSGFAGLAAASLLAKQGYDVTVLEKNSQPGGRAGIWKKDGFTFDMGPSWYWMPEVFEEFYNLFDKTTADFYELKRLDPGYRVYFGKDDKIDVPADMSAIEEIFNTHESGSAEKLKTFLKQAKYKYEVGMKEYVFKPSLSIKEYLSLKLLRQSFGIQMFSGMASHIRQFFKNSRLIKILEFPVLFLGSTPQNTPAMYSMMNYADLALGTWYPLGGMNEIVKAMVAIAQSQGVKFHFNEEVTEIINEGERVTGVKTKSSFWAADVVISNADYHHTDQVLTAQKWRNYSAGYWNTRILSPSSLLFYIGLDSKLENIQHHNLFFDEDFSLHANEIYADPKWPTKPLFYVCCPSITDQTSAPPDGENLFFLIPVAPGLKDTEDIRERYFEMLVERFEDLTGQKIRERIVVKRSYAHNDFISDYHSFKGNAYGLANTLLQTAFLKPKMQSSKLKNLFYTGQLTVPGPGVPPAIISGRVVAKQVTTFLESFNRN